MTTSSEVNHSLTNMIVVIATFAILSIVLYWGVLGINAVEPYAGEDKMDGLVVEVESARALVHNISKSKHPDVIKAYNSQLLIVVDSARVLFQQHLSKKYDVPMSYTAGILYMDTDCTDSQFFQTVDRDRMRALHFNLTIECTIGKFSIN